MPKKLAIAIAAVVTMMVVGAFAANAGQGVREKVNTYDGAPEVIDGLIAGVTNCHLTTIETTSMGTKIYTIAASDGEMLKVYDNDDWDLKLKSVVYIDVAADGWHGVDDPRSMGDSVTYTWIMEGVTLEYSDKMELREGKLKHWVTTDTNLLPGQVNPAAIQGDYKNGAWVRQQDFLRLMTAAALREIAAEDGPVDDDDVSVRIGRIPILGDGDSGTILLR